MGCCTEQSVWQPLINLGRVGRGVEMLVVGCAVIFMAKKETKMLPFDVAQRSQHSCVFSIFYSGSFSFFR